MANENEVLYVFVTALLHRYDTRSNNTFGELMRLNCLSLRFSTLSVSVLPQPGPI